MGFFLKRYIQAFDIDYLKRGIKTATSGRLGVLVSSRWQRGRDVDGGSALVAE